MYTFSNNECKIIKELSGLNKKKIIVLLFILKYNIIK